MTMGEASSVSTLAPSRLVNTLTASIFNSSTLHGLNRRRVIANASRLFVNAKSRPIPVAELAVPVAPKWQVSPNPPCWPWVVETALPAEMPSPLSLPLQLEPYRASHVCLVHTSNLRTQTMKTISGLFDTHEEASEAVDALEDAGIARRTRKPAAAA